MQSEHLLSMNTNSDINAIAAESADAGNEIQPATASAENALAVGSNLPTHKKKKPKLHIAHKTDGRIRMRVPHGRDNPEVLEAYKQIFSQIHGIIDIKIKPETGSIIINYAPEHEHEFHAHLNCCCSEHSISHPGPLPGDEIQEMAKRIENQAEFFAEHSEIVKVTVDMFKKLDYQIKLKTDNTIDLKVLLACGLAAATFVEIGAETATPMWVTLGLFAVNHFIDINSPHVAAKEVSHHHHHHHHG